MAPQARPKLVSSFGWQVLGGMAIGVLLGLLARSLGPDGGGALLAQGLDILGSSFIQMLRALVPPLIFTAIVASIANLAGLQNAAALVWRTLLWFAITAFIAVVIGIALGLVLEPGRHAGAALPTAEPGVRGSWLDFLVGLVPSNFLGLTGSGAAGDDGKVRVSLSFNVLQILVISLVIGAAALKAGEAGKSFIAFNASALAVIRKVLWWVIRLTPLGTIGLLGTAVAQYGWDTLGQLGRFTVAVYLGLAIVLLGVYPILLLAHRLSPVAFFRKVWPAIQLGFVSRSSVGTMPVTEAVTVGLGVPKPYAAFAVPLGSTTKMDGCAAIYPAIAAIFVAQFYGLPLHATDYFLIVFVSVLGSAATAGLTGAAVMLTLTLSTLGLPLEGAGLLLAIDPILDMGRTAVNVAGQALVPALVAKRAGVLDDGIYAGGGADEALEA